MTTTASPGPARTNVAAERRNTETEIRASTASRKRERAGNDVADALPATLLPTSRQFFRGASENPQGTTRNSFQARARQYPGKMSKSLMQRMADQVGRDGVAEGGSDRDMPVCVQAYFNRVLALEGSGGIPANQRRDRRECETLYVILDKLAKCRSPGWFGFGGGCLLLVIFPVIVVVMVMSMVVVVGIRWIGSAVFVSLARRLALGFEKRPILQPSS